jgi:hypothetical protein
LEASLKLIASCPLSLHFQAESLSSGLRQISEQIGATLREKAEVYSF